MRPTSFQVEQLLHQISNLGNSSCTAPKEVVVVSSDSGLWRHRRLYRAVDMETGKVSNAPSDVILTALAEANPSALDSALDLAAELRLERARPDLVKILADGAIPLKTRLRAAVALGAMGDRRGSDLVRAAALEKSDCREYAIDHVADLLGDNAAIVLCEVMRRGDEDVAEKAVVPMRKVSAGAAVPPLVALLREGKTNSLDAVISCLIEQGAAAKDAIPDLVKVLETEPKTRRPLWTQHFAAMALGKIGPAAAPALPALTRLAEKHASEEWNRLKDRPPPFLNPFDNRARLAEDYFVDAILRIRRSSH
jgi:hypothetical protein